MPWRHRFFLRALTSHFANYIAFLMTSIYWYRSYYQNDKRFMLAPHYAMSAWMIGFRRTASRIAEWGVQEAKSQPRDSIHATAIHYCHSILGLAALGNEDVDSAATHLMESANITCAPIKPPTFVLAHELFRHDEKEVVIAYLKQVAKHWKNGRKWARRWSGQIRRGAEVTMKEDVARLSLNWQDGIREQCVRYVSNHKNRKNSG